MSTKRLVLTAISLAFLFALASDEARALQFASPSPVLNNPTREIAEANPSRVLARTLQSRQKSFSLMSEPSTASMRLSAPAFNLGPAAVMAAVTGGGTAGRLSKWTGVAGASTFVLGDSTIFEDKFGKVGIGTDAPTAKLTVAGVLESTVGGFKFPDGSAQTTSAAGALFSVAHDTSLVGSGTAAAPLGVAPSFVSALTGEPFQQQVNVTVLNNGIQGTAMITVPNNKRLTIEFVSAYCELLGPSPLIDRFEITSSVGGQAARYQFSAVKTLAGVIEHYLTNQQVVIHADSGSTVTVSVLFSSMLANGAVGRVSISGRLFDAP
jgi:hypothetical protein